MTEMLVVSAGCLGVGMLLLSIVWIWTDSEVAYLLLLTVTAALISVCVIGYLTVGVA
jgi:hypothetical protein